MKRYVPIILLLLLSYGSFCVELNGSIIDIVPWGYLDKNNNINGIHKQILDEITKRTQIKFNYQLKPLARFVKEIERNETDFGMLIMRNKFKGHVDELCSIQDLFQYLIYSKKFQKSNSSTPKQLIVLNEELLHSDERYLRYNIDINKITVFKVTNYTHMFSMLRMNRADVALFTSGAFKKYLDKNQYSKNDFGEIKTFHKQHASFFMPLKAKGYSKKISLKIKRALVAMVKDGTMARINNHKLHHSSQKIDAKSESTNS